MDYKLAKQLKEAGFEQKGNGYYLLYVPENSKQLRPSYWKKIISRNAGNKSWVNEHYYVPSISEMIEAIGLSFRWLKRENTNLKGHKWHASAKGIERVNEEGRKIKEKDFRGTGRTPDEAVANLYLAIKKA